MKVAISAFDSLNAMYQNTIAFLIRTASEHTDRPKQKAGK
jgi:hypothetical protein